MSFESLEGKKYVSVTTYRSSGVKVPTPVWFVLKDGRVYVWTETASGKVKRLRHNPKLALAPCKMNGTPLGPYVDGVASISQDDSSTDLRQAFKSKYGLMLALSRTFIRRNEKQVFLEITPA
jgi:hypothetical protein